MPRHRADAVELPLKNLPVKAEKRMQNLRVVLGICF
jgi:hypothetical protein